MVVHGVILAAGQGTRMRSVLPKVLHQIGGKFLLQWVQENLTKALVSLNHQDFCMTYVLNPNLPHVINVVQNWQSGHAHSTNDLEKQEETGITTKAKQGYQIDIALQTEQLGTAHAVWVGVQHSLYRYSLQDTLLVVLGDVPGVEAQTLAYLLQEHKRTGAAYTIAGFALSPDTNPLDHAYGRVLFNPARIVEFKDCTPDEKQTTCCNSGMLVCQIQDFIQDFPRISNKNAAQEWYLTDLPLLANQQNKIVHMVTLPWQECMGINTLEELAQRTQYFRKIGKIT
jgi:bifunctional UDP-N-acetylglucosamine pyrophosphorylase / glucosamine-1-phosphate N-acetyltransferase